MVAPLILRQSLSKMLDLTLEDKLHPYTMSSPIDFIKKAFVFHHHHPLFNKSFWNLDGWSMGKDERVNNATWLSGWCIWWINWVLNCPVPQAKHPATSPA